MAISDFENPDYQQKQLANAMNKRMDNIENYMRGTAHIRPLMDDGVAFPASPATGMVFLRTDLNAAFYYDGAAWQSYSVTSGSSFPASPPTNMLFFNTTYQKLAYYDGTRWLTVATEPMGWTAWAAAGSFAASTNWLAFAPPGDILLVDGKFCYNTVGTNSATNYWKVILVNSAGTLEYAKADTSATAINTKDTATFTLESVNNNIVTAAQNGVYLKLFPVGAPTNIFNTFATIRYRQILT